MIAAYNRKQLAFAILSAAGAVVCYALAYGFFRFSFWIVAVTAGFYRFSGYASLAAGLTLVVITFSGYRTWRQRGGLYSYHESGLYRAPSSVLGGGAYVVDLYAHRVTGPAYVLGQIFLSGPLLALRALSHLHNRIPHEPGLEARLQAVLERLRAANKWQGEADYVDSMREILLLARMRQIDFSVAKGTARFKALPEPAQARDAP